MEFYMKRFILFILATSIIFLSGCNFFLGTDTTDSQTEVKILPTLNAGVPTTVRAVDVSDYLNSADNFEAANTDMNVLMSGAPIITGFQNNTANYEIGDTYTNKWLDIDVEITITEENGSIVYTGSFTDNDSYFKLTYNPANSVFQYKQEIVIKFSIDDGYPASMASVVTLTDGEVTATGFSSEDINPKIYMQEGADEDGNYTHPLFVERKGSIKKDTDRFILHLTERASESDSEWESGEVTLTSLSDVPDFPDFATFQTDNILLLNLTDKDDGWKVVDPNCDAEESVPVLEYLYETTATLQDSPTQTELETFLDDFDVANGTDFRTLYDEGVDVEDFTDLNNAIVTFILEN